MSERISAGVLELLDQVPPLVRLELVDRIRGLAAEAGTARGEAREVRAVYGAEIDRLRTAHMKACDETTAARQDCAGLRQEVAELRERIAGLEAELEQARAVGKGRRR